MFPNLTFFIFIRYLLGNWSETDNLPDHIRVPSLPHNNSNSWVCCEDISFVVKVDGCYAQNVCH